uniref:Ammonium transporter AmtB-like domain-containing protein n=1 Tax=Zooxanthella nutricula TaxID=1333877 RepID=A0A7S2KY21_9DINO
MEDAKHGFTAGQVAANTTLAAACGGAAMMVLRGLICRSGEDVGAACNGVLAGLVAISAGCANVSTYSACGIGAAAGVLCCLASMLVRHLKVDDPSDAFAVHGVGGFWGLAAAVLFDWGEGFHTFYGPAIFNCITVGTGDGCNPEAWTQAMAANLAEAAFVLLFSMVVALAAVLPLRCIRALRVEAELGRLAEACTDHWISDLEGHVVMEAADGTSRTARGPLGGLAQASMEAEEKALAMGSRPASTLHMI